MPRPSVIPGIKARLEKAKDKKRMMKILGTAELMEAMKA